MTTEVLSMPRPHIVRSPDRRVRHRRRNPWRVGHHAARWTLLAIGIGLGVWGLTHAPVDPCVPVAVQGE